jgi:O-succinylhomoserine sulfhydrylase
MMMERRLAALEGTSGCIATASGMGAITLLAMGLLKAGDHVVCSRSVFGSTIKLLGDVFGRFGVESTFVSQTDVGEWRAAMRPNTRLLFAESPTNPLTEVCDIAALAEVAHAAGPAGGGQLLLLAGPAAARQVGRRLHHPFRHQVPGRPGPGHRRCRLRSGGTDPVQAAAGAALGGADALALQRLGGAQGHGDPGGAHEGPERQRLAVAQWLEAHPAVARVHYPGLASHPSTRWP